jgi:hypothetical protein
MISHLAGPCVVPIDSSGRVNIASYLIDRPLSGQPVKHVSSLDCQIAKADRTVETQQTTEHANFRDNRMVGHRTYQR